MKRAAIVGGGTIGSGWAARFLLNGWDVSLFDPSPETQEKALNVLEKARKSLPGIYDRALPPEGRLTFASSIAEAVSRADWVQESVSERISLKHQVYSEILETLPDGGFIASSTSGIKASDLGANGAPVVVVHPFNPVYLLPLAELSGEKRLRERAEEVVRTLGMYPLHLETEIDAFIGNRFQEAVWREALWMIHDGVATTEQVDEAIRMGFGLRWAQVGLFETMRMAGGTNGMAAYFEQFAPTLSWPWSKLTNVPDLDEALVKKIAGQTDAQSAGRSVDDMERSRDENLVAMLRALRLTETGAGQVIVNHEKTLHDGGEIEGLPITSRRSAPCTWLDDNGRMTEAAYVELGSWASDKMMRLVGVDQAYVENGKSFLAVDTRLCCLQEVREESLLTTTTQVVGAEGCEMRLYHRILGPDGLAATIETVLVHTDLRSRRSCDPEPSVAAAMKEYALAHKAHPAPKLGGSVGRHE